MALDNAMDLHNIPSTHSRDEEDEDPEHVSPPDEPEFSPDASDIARMNRMRVHSERMRLHQSFERRNPLNIEIDGPLMPPVPESRDYTAIEERRREIQRGHIRDLRRIARRHPAAPPPFAEADVDRRVTYYYPRTERSQNSTPSSSRNTPPDDVAFDVEDQPRTLQMSYTRAQPMLYGNAPLVSPHFFLCFTSSAALNCGIISSEQGMAPATVPILLNSLSHSNYENRKTM